MSNHHVDDDMKPNALDTMNGKPVVIEEQGVRVSAVMVTYFTGPVLARAITALKAQPEISEIILVNNGNWDGAVEEASQPHESGPEVRILSGHGNIGFAAACNLGARAAQNDHLLLINPDAIMSPGGVAQLIKDHADCDRPSMLGAKLVDIDGIEQSGSRRMNLTPWRAFVEITKLYKLAPRHPYFRRFNLHSDPCPDEITPVPVTSGACIFMVKDDYWMIDGMDERYFLHVEDVDFCLRFGNAGGIVYFDPNVTVTHFKGTSRANRINVEYQKAKGMQLYFKRHFSHAYPVLFMWLVQICVWLRFGALCIVHAGRRFLSFLGLRKKHGPVAIKRAHAMSSKRISR